MLNATSIVIKIGISILPFIHGLPDAINTGSTPTGGTAERCG